jgi:DNA-binding NtrC family response regulator
MISWLSPEWTKGSLISRREPEALAIVNAGPFSERLRTFFETAAWRLSIVENCADGTVRQKRDPAPVVFCDRDLIGCDWRKVVAQFSKSEVHPYVILLTRSSDTDLWDELIQNGGSDILRLSADRDLVLSAVEAGWLHWRSQQRLRLAEEIRKLRVRK